jgi:hypothetical protein
MTGPNPLRGTFPSAVESWPHLALPRLPANPVIDAKRDHAGRWHWSVRTQGGDLIVIGDSAPSKGEALGLAKAWVDAGGWSAVP